MARSEVVWGAHDGSDPDSSGEVPPAASEPRSSRPARAPQSIPDWLKPPGDPESGPPAGRDPVAVLGVVAGFVGIVFLGILLAIVAGFLGAWAGQRARESGRTYELPYLAIGLAFVDAIVWLAVHYLTKTPVWVG